MRYGGVLPCSTEGTEVLEIASFFCRELQLPVPWDPGSAKGETASVGPSPPRLGAAFKERAHTLALAPGVLPSSWYPASLPIL